MSVLVKGMEMPKNCIECIRSDLRTTIKCMEWTKISAGRRENERAWSCPLVELPSNVDAVEVVRCKDCKYARMTYDGECKYCDIWFPDEAVYIDGDSFCSSAERKEE